MLKELAKLGDKLDSFGLFKEASFVDKMLSKVAQDDYDPAARYSEVQILVDQYNLGEFFKNLKLNMLLDVQNDAEKMKNILILLKKIPFDKISAWWDYHYKNGSEDYSFEQRMAFFLTGMVENMKVFIRSIAQAQSQAQGISGQNLPLLQFVPDNFLKTLGSLRQIQRILTSISGVVAKRITSTADAFGVLPEWNESTATPINAPVPPTEPNATRSPAGQRGNIPDVPTNAIKVEFRGKTISDGLYTYKINYSGTEFSWTNNRTLKGGKKDRSDPQWNIMVQNINYIPLGSDEQNMTPIVGGNVQ
jgi:hypothetical protein